jgi:hypothetical protein|tara:strand:- start:3776 stop:3964 length:189 start_codon:yes stop_codon:yes gene_type:complete
MINDRRIDPEIDEGTQRFFSRLIYTLIVLNILIGVPTIYDIYFYEHQPIVYRDTSIIEYNEI